MKLLVYFYISALLALNLVAEKVYKIPKLKSSKIQSWDSAGWKKIRALKVNCFLLRHSKFKPKTEVKIFRSKGKIHVLFKVDDQYVIAKARKHFDEVFFDSAVEMFFSISTPGKKGACRYFNFEFNCTGKAVARLNNIDIYGNRKVIKNFSLDDIKKLNIKTSLKPGFIDKEITDKLIWYVYFELPEELLRKYVPEVKFKHGIIWYANFYKCAVRNSHPHYAAWNKIAKVNFHCPEYFGKLIFE